MNAWKESRIWVWVYKVTADFHADEKFGLISQLRRAAVELSNHAEVPGRKSKELNF
ncbi:MAG: four helix bundle protein [Chitinophagaceae bacterium]|nr:four helix bundle protein [Chitinophagaceae bacterium]